MQIVAMRTALVVTALLFLFSRPAAALPLPCTYLDKRVDAEPPSPIFLASFPAAAPGPLSGVAFLYDNSVAAVALVGCGRRDLAERIGEAILAALAHDRFWHDGRLRNAYAAGLVVANPVALPGWWDKAQNRWVEDRYQVASDTGNMAWAMLALLALHRAGAGPQYLAGATRIGAWVEKTFNPLDPGGFMGGTFGHEPAPERNTWKSVEHNADLAAAFRQLADATGDRRWRERAQAAERFVAAMWNRHCRCFLAGTAADGHTPNPTLAVDAQLWPLLAIHGASSRYAAAFATAGRRLGVAGGFSYGEGGQSVWTEGTAQAALLMELLGRSKKAKALQAIVEKNRSADGGYYAASAAQLPTGFMLQTDPSQPRQYFHMPHLAAAAWAALAQRRFNPFTGTNSLPAG